jgi:hypothetical protein
MIVKGQRGPHYMGQRPSRSGKIVRVVDVWIGTEAEIKGINFSSYNGYNIGRVGDSPVWQAEAWKETSPSGALITDVFDLKFNTKQEPIRYNPVLQESLDTDEVGFIYFTFNEMKRGALTYDEALVDVRALNDPADDAQQLFDWIIAGQNNYFAFDYAFIWTRSAASGVSIPINYFGENAVYTSTANMLAGEGATGLSYDLPSKQWLKLPVDISEQYGGRLEVRYEFWGADEWPALLYSRV